MRPEVPDALIYKGVRIEPAYEADVVVDNSVIVEVKAVEALHEIHDGSSTRISVSQAAASACCSTSVGKR